MVDETDSRQVQLSELSQIGTFLVVAIINDEPSHVDGLDRSKFAEAISDVVATCDTPLVLGLYGTWGVGKTSLMRIIEHELQKSGEALTVWFDAWQHQFDENPAVALLHTMVDELGLGENGRRLLKVISSALGSILLKSTTSLGASDLVQIQERYDEERFLVREKQIRLRKHFSELLSEATDDGRIRIVFFVDDLDRCVPEKILEVLEALKLFLNIPGCVYVLGVDRAALETSIKHRYAGTEISEASYLDKIVQLPFSIPPIAGGASQSFIAGLLPEDLKDLAPDLAQNLGENPRQVKRFVNSLALNHKLAQGILTEQYSAQVLASLLLLQYKSPDLFKEVVRNPEIIISGKSDEERLQNMLSGETSQYVTTVMQKRAVRDIGPYIFLSEVAGIRQIGYDVFIADSGERKIQVIKVIREITHLGLKEAKDLCDSVPTILLTGVTKEEAENASQALSAAGATVELR